MAQEKQLTYQQAVAEIENILQQMENNKTDVDRLAEKVKRALSLLNFCTEKLRATEEEIAQITSRDGLPPMV